MKKKEDRVSQSVVNAESVGFTVALFGVLLLLIACTGRFVFGAVGTAACGFLFGVFGFAVYFVLAGVVLLGVRLIVGRPIVAVKRFVLYLSLFLASLFLTVHAFVMPLEGFSYGGYIGHCYQYGTGWVTGCTPFGALGAALWFPLHLATGYGAYVIMILLSLLFLALTVFSVLSHYGIRLFNNTMGQKKESTAAKEVLGGQTQSFSEMDIDGGETPVTLWKNPTNEKQKPAPTPFVPEKTDPEPIDYRKALFGPKSSDETHEKKMPEINDYKSGIAFLYDPRNADEYRTQNLIFDENSQFNNRVRSSVKPKEEARQPSTGQTEHRNVYSELTVKKAEEPRLSSVASEKPVIRQAPTENRGGYPSYNPDIYKKHDEESNGSDTFRTPSVSVEENRSTPSVTSDYSVPLEEDRREETPTSDFGRDSFRRAEEEESSLRREEEFPRSDRETDRYSPREDSSREADLIFEERNQESDYRESLPRTESSSSDRRDEFQDMFSDYKENIFDDGEELPDESAEPEASFRSDDGVDISSVEEERPVQPEQKKPRIIKDYVRPPLSLLRTYSDGDGMSDDEVEATKNAIVDTLAGFDLDVEVKNVVVGPVFTRYDIVLPRSVNVNKILNYQREISMSVHSDNVNIYANFEQGAVSIEVPNKTRLTIGMKSLLLTDSYQEARSGSLMFAVGRDADGKSVCLDLCKMPHMLVAGTTGSGKSVFLHSMIISLIMRYSPEELRMIIIDPKWTEFSVYENLPHLMINEVLQDVKKVTVALNWAIAEMERRFRLFGQMTQKGIVVRNVDEYNEKIRNREEKLPKLVIIADEVYDLMVQAKGDIESRISRLAAKARAAGIHLVLATQRPSREVVTGVLKANLPARFALKVDSDINSRIILDSNGAEKLLGKGDLLYRAGSMTEPKRVQCAWIDSPEIQDICNFIRENNESYYDEAVNAYIASEGKSSLRDGSGLSEEKGSDDVEPVYIDALRFIIKSKSASISMVQRKCSVGFNKAGKIIEWMERSGYISPYDGNSMKPRNVLITEDEFREKFGDL